MEYCLCKIFCSTIHKCIENNKESMENKKTMNIIRYYFRKQAGSTLSVPCNAFQEFQSHKMRGMRNEQEWKGKEGEYIIHMWMKRSKANKICVNNGICCERSTNKCLQQCLVGAHGNRYARIAVLLHVSLHTSTRRSASRPTPSWQLNSRTNTFRGRIPVGETYVYNAYWNLNFNITNWLWILKT